MSDDLDALGAPLEALRKEVDDAYARLGAYWTTVTAKLAQLPIPCDVGYSFIVDESNPMFCTRLEWCKYKKKKRLCIVEYGLENTPYGTDEYSIYTPYEEWSGDQRLRMKRFVPDLFQAAVQQVGRFIEETKE